MRLVVPLLLTACSGVKFDVTPGSEQEIASLCGLNQTEAAGPKITAPPRDQPVRASFTVEGTCIGSADVTLTGPGLGAALTVACEDGRFRQDVTVTSGDGIKALQAAQAGSESPGKRCVLLDSQAPTVTITPPVPALRNSSILDVRGTCETGLAVDLTPVDGGASVRTTCSDGTFRAPVLVPAGDGTRLVRATQTDVAGNVGEDRKSWIVDTSPPLVRIVDPITDLYVRDDVDVTGTCESGLPVTIGGEAAFATVTVGCVNGQFTGLLTIKPMDGMRTIQASQIDAAGNVGVDQRNVMRDTTPPAIKITDPAANSVARDGLRVLGTCADGFPVVLNGAGVGAPVTVACNTGTFEAAILFSAADGPKPVIAAQTDAAGNVGTDSRTFVRDAAAPVLEFTNPDAGTATRGPLALTGTCETGLNVTISGPVTPTLVACANGQFSAGVTLTGADGEKTVTAAQTDAVGNVGTTSRMFRLVTTAPAVAITAPGANSVTRDGLLVSGSCTSGLTVRLAGDVVAALDVACANARFSGRVTLSAPDGSKMVSATQTDDAGNVGRDNRTFVRDTAAPLVTITTPAAGSLYRNVVMVTGTCEAGLPVEVGGSGVAASGPVTCPNGAFSASVTLSDGDGTKTIEAAQTDAAGNTGRATRDVSKDGTLPNVRITAPLMNTVTRNTIALVGVCETGLDVNVAGDAQPQAVACVNDAFAANVTFTAPDGTKIVMVTQTDAAMNVGFDNRAFVLDTTAPLVTIASPANAAVITQAFTLSGRCEAGLTLNITGDLTAPSASACPAGGTYAVALNATATPGAKSVSASQTDLAGNATTVTANYTLGATPTATETFVADASEGKVDILFVDDNSASMDPEQNKLGQRFPSFVNALIGLDWQVGITTTDCSTGTWGICGSLLQMTGTMVNVLSSAIANYETIFSNTISRPETVDCVNRGACPSGNEEAMKATIGAIDKRAGSNAGFFRDGAALAVVVLTDEDEQSTAPATATTPQAVVDKFRDTWGTTKQLRAYAITVIAGDTACLQMQKDQQGGIGAFGSYPTELARLTGGQSQSICAADYSGILKAIGDDLRTVTNAVKLTRAPNPVASVRVSFNPARNITWSVSGSTVLFNSPVPAGTQITVTYQY